MGFGRVPSVFVSSTCFDLGQVRSNIKDFLEGLGYEAVLSEYSSFPIDPDQNTVDNCIKVLDAKADILVLVVGGRYGALSTSGKSITNLEYLRALAKGIPIYVFVMDTVLNALPLWRANPNADFSSLVQSNMVFNFISDIYEKGSKWVFPFRSAADITATLRQQFAYLFMDSLSQSRKFKDVGIPLYLRQSSPSAIFLYLERPPVWPGRLLLQLLKDELVQCRPLKHDMDYRIVTGSSTRFKSYDEFSRWLNSITSRLGSLYTALESIINNAFGDAVGSTAEPDAEKLAYVANRLSIVYREAISIYLDVLKVDLHENILNVLIDNLLKYSKTIVEDIEEFVRLFEVEIDRAIIAFNSLKHNEIISVHVSYSLTLPETQAVMDEFPKIQTYFENLM